jgi:hypothetical protein
MPTQSNSSPLCGTAFSTRTITFCGPTENPAVPRRSVWTSLFWVSTSKSMDDDWSTGTALTVTKPGPL